MPSIELAFADRSEVFSVRNFRVTESLSTPFSIVLSVRSSLDDADLDALAGSDATFTLHRSADEDGVGERGAASEGTLAWRGVLTHAELVHAEPTGLSTYAMTLSPALWLLTQRSNCRVFRRLTAPGIVATILREWGIEVDLRVDERAHPVLDFRVQYNESDYGFVARTLEEAGVTYFTRTVDGQTRVTLSDRPHEAEQTFEPIPFHGDAHGAAGQRYATNLHRSTNVRTSAFRGRDYDFRRPAFDFHADSPARGSIAARDARLEQYDYLPGASLAIDATGASDARASGVSDPNVLQALARRRLEALRVDRRTLSFHTNVLAIQPGAITSIADHPRTDVAHDVPLLVVATTLSGAIDSSWRMSVTAAYASDPYRPPVVTPRPVITGVQSATVVGPRSAADAVSSAPGQEIHVDEHGRVRVLFPWDQDGARGEGSSCWVRVSQLWATANGGAIFTPRIGDEVLVSFLDGDPDLPVIVGRLYNSTHLHPFRLPQERSLSGIRSRTTTGGEGYNEVSFEDRAGFEALRLTAQKDLVEAVGRDHHATVLRNRVERIAGDASMRVEGTRAEAVVGNAVLAVEGNRTEAVAGARSSVEGSSQLHVLGDRDERVDQALRATVAGPARIDHQGGLDHRVAGGAARGVTGDDADVVTGSRNVVTGGAAFASVGGRASLSAIGGVSVVSGRAETSGVVAVGPDGVVSVNAPDVRIVAATTVVFEVGTSKIVIEDGKITLDAKLIELAAVDEASIVTDEASTVWTTNIASKSKVFRAVSADGGSLELTSKATLDGSKIQLGQKASQEQKKAERRKQELPKTPKCKVVLHDAAGEPIRGAVRGVDARVHGSGDVELGHGGGARVRRRQSVRAPVGAPRDIA